MIKLTLFVQMFLTLDNIDIVKSITPSATSLDQLVERLAEKDIIASRSSVHRFLQQNNLALPKKFVSDEQLMEVTHATVSALGSYYGRKTLKGALASQGIMASQRRIANCLRSINPENHIRRALNINRQLNPRKYKAPHFGYNIHFDQNEKLVDYGVVLVLAVDGHSNFLVSGCVMPCKNNLTIYEHVYRTAVEQFGMWEQVVVDCGREFFLALFIQEHLQLYRVDEAGNCSKRLPYRQIRSTENNRIERIWVEVNQRILYTYKYACLELQNEGTLNPNNLCHAFTISWFLQKCVALQLSRFIAAWNEHPIPRSGVPSAAIVAKKNFAIPEIELPTVGHAVALYTSANQTAKLTDPHYFCEDIVPEERKQERDEMFENILEQNLESIVNSMANKEYTLFKQCFIQLLSVETSFFQ